VKRKAEEKAEAEAATAAAEEAAVVAKAAEDKAEAREVIENKHSTEAESTNRVCASM